LHQGKSSLINNIIQKDLCITSKSPGRTQLPYYYGLIPKIKDKRNDTENIKKSIPLSSSKTMKKDPSTVQGYVVDLPGYGFGMAPKAVVDGWQQDTQDLLLHRRHEAKVLQRLFLLMDARRGEPNEIDRTVMRWLEDAEIPYTIVLTKADRVSLPLVVKQVNDFCVRYASQHHHHDEEEVGGVAQSPIVHITSSKQGWGVQELRLSIEAEFFPEDKDDQYHSDHEDCQQ
jgi:GTP-binding protein EngB required for normal cell division